MDEGGAIHYTLVRPSQERPCFECGVDMFVGDTAVRDTRTNRAYCRKSCLDLGREKAE